MHNVTAINELADFIEASLYEFDMAEAKIPRCGIAGCIGGFAGLLWSEVIDVESNTVFPVFDDGALRAKLGFSHQECRDLCFPLEGGWADFSDLIMKYEGFTRKGAVATLRRLAQTGEVVWLKTEQTL